VEHSEGKGGERAVVTPLITKSLIKLIKLQLSPNARLIKSPKYKFKFKDKD
jgi:hypothetical protein